MSNIYVKGTIEKNRHSQNFQVSFREAPTQADISEF